MLLWRYSAKISIPGFFCTTDQDENGNPTISSIIYMLKGISLNSLSGISDIEFNDESFVEQIWNIAIQLSV